MADPQSIETPTVLAHKRQLVWQILIPFFIVLALIVVVAVVIATGSAPTNRTLADISTIWLIAPLLVVAVLFALVLGSLIFALAKLMQVTPRYTGKAQDFFALLSGWARIGADGAAKPFVWAQQAGAMLKSIFKL